MEREIAINLAKLNKGNKTIINMIYDDHEKEIEKLQGKLYDIELETCNYCLYQNCNQICPCVELSNKEVIKSCEKFKRMELG